MTAAVAQLVTALGPDAPDDGEPGRLQRGTAIAALARIEDHKHGYRVPSQSGRGHYIVSLDEDGRYCTCPDYALRRRDCKHLVAVQLRAHRESEPGGAVAAETAAIAAAATIGRPKQKLVSTVEMGLSTETDIEIEHEEDTDGHGAAGVSESAVVAEGPGKKKKRPTYQRDWRKYDMAKTHEAEHVEALLANLCGLVHQPPYEGGRPYLNIADVIYSLVWKAYVGQSRRIVMSPLRTAEERELISKTPSPSTLTSYLKREELTPILKHLIMQSTLPLWGLDNGVFATDATGFRTSVHHRWFEHKHGRKGKKGK